MTDETSCAIIMSMFAAISIALVLDWHLLVILVLVIMAAMIEGRLDD